MSTVLKGATVVDGTRAEPVETDVRIDDGRIVEIGPIDAATGAVVDLRGLVLAPGFIDPHTHYDAQVLWDPDLSPSSWHGVTTVVMGNTGFTIAPNRPEVRPFLLEMLSVVEGMSHESLSAGIDWVFSDFPAYLDRIEALPLRINVASMVGHSTVRYAAMGADAMDREATPDEVRTMRNLVADALAAGAVGFSTSRSASHVGAMSKPVPSRVGALGEIWELADALRQAGTGVIEATWGTDLFVDEMAALSEEFGRPVTWAAVLTVRGKPEWTRDILERTAALGGDVHPQMACKPVGTQIDLARPGTMAVLPAFAAAMARPVPERLEMFADREWRRKAAQDIAAHPTWSDRLVRARVQVSPGNPDLAGRALGEIADARGTTPMDLMLDLVAEDTLQTRFAVVVMNDAEDEVAGLLHEDRLLMGLGDGGAHTAQLCDADAPTYLLGRWWRERRAISLQDAVWRITGHPAAVFGLADRGRIEVGYVADLVAFDPATVGGLPMERLDDLPGGAERLVVRSTGVEHMWVRGEPVRRDAQPVPGAHPGALLRGGRG